MWTPRVLTILFAAFISLFALDVFQEGVGFWMTLGALLLHLVPTFLLLGLLALSWKREWIAGLIFIVLAGTYAVQAREHISWIAAISGPLLLIAVFFMVAWYNRKKHPTKG